MPKIQQEIKDYHIILQPTTLTEFYNPLKQKKDPEFEEIVKQTLYKPLGDFLNFFLFSRKKKNTAENNKEEEDDDYNYEEEEEEYDYYDEEEEYEEEEEEYEEGDEELVDLTHARNETFIREDKKIGRNDPCTCGSGKKYKKCHGKNN